MNDIAITVSNNNANLNALETIDAISKAGFKKVFLEWYHKDYLISQNEQLDYCLKQGLEVLFFHLSPSNINSLWLEGEKGDELIENYKKDLSFFHEKGIDKVCMHLCSKTDAPGPNALGLKRLRNLIDYAKELKMQIAFENTKIQKHLDYVFGEIKDEHVGFCLDSGHLHAHFNDEMNFDLVKGRIFLVHLHDNDGSSDQHLLPFDGSIDWKWLLELLKELDYQGELIFELVYRNEYTSLSIDEFYKKAYQLANKLDKMR